VQDVSLGGLVNFFMENRKKRLSLFHIFIRHKQLESFDRLFKIGFDFEIAGVSFSVDAQGLDGISSLRHGL